MIKNEKEVVRILELLETDYYTQSIPYELTSIGRPIIEITEEEFKQKYSFRIKRDKYRRKLDSLFDKKLSVDFLGDLYFIKKYESTLPFYKDKIIEVLFNKKTELAYKEIFEIFEKTPFSENNYNDFTQSNYIGKKLTSLNKYCDEIETYILEKDSTGINGFSYFCNYAGTPYSEHSTFSESTKKEILDRLINFMIKNLESDPNKSFNPVSLFERYFKKDFIEYPPEEGVDFNEHMSISAEKWREEGHRKSAKNVIEYYKSLQK